MRWKILWASSAYGAALAVLLPGMKNAIFCKVSAYGREGTVMIFFLLMAMGSG
jgi:hypothetical protein